MNGDEKKLMTLREADREIKRIAEEGFDAGYYGTGTNPFDCGTFERDLWEEFCSRGSYERSVVEMRERQRRGCIADEEAKEARKENKNWYQFWI